MNMEAIERVRETLAGKVTDLFSLGDVIRWVSGDKYVYVAVKTPIGWFTSARTGNTFVDQVYDYDGLIEVLSRSDVTSIDASGEWMVIL